MLKSASQTSDKPQVVGGNLLAMYVNMHRLIQQPVFVRIHLQCEYIAYNWYGQTRASRA